MLDHDAIEFKGALNMIQLCGGRWKNGKNSFLRLSCEKFHFHFIAKL